MNEEKRVNEIAHAKISTAKIGESFGVVHDVGQELENFWRIHEIQMLFRNVFSLSWCTKRNFSLLKNTKSWWIVVETRNKVFEQIRDDYMHFSC